MKIVELAEKIGTEAHDGQFRDGGLPYITHPKAVAAIVKLWIEKYDSSFPTELAQDFLYLIDSAWNVRITYSEFEQVMEAIDLLHDTIEDTKGTKKEITALDLRNKGLEFLNSDRDKQLWIEYVVPTVESLSRDKEKESYFEYLKKVKLNRMARLAKVGDLTHNMSDLKPGSRRDKYELAMWFLLN